MTDGAADEGINGAALIGLLQEDLKELGVDSVGHRIAILKAIWELKKKQNVPIQAFDYVPQCKSG